MKKIALLLLVGAVAVTPVMAASKKKEPKMSEAAAQRDASWRLVKNGLPLILPSWLLPVYFHMHDQDADAKKKKEKK